jgi:hypothetical protein
MKIKIHCSLFISFLFISNLVTAQQQKDSSIDSTNFLFPKFTDGVITMKDGNEATGKFNYNMLLDEMQFINPPDEIMSLASPSKVLKVVIASRTFIYLKNYFVEILTDGNVSLFYRAHVKRFAEKIGAYGGSSATSSIESVATYTSTDGSLTRLSGNEKVSYKNELTYYIMQNGKVKILFELNDLLKCFPENKDLIQQEIEKQHANYTDVESVKKIIDWINAKGLKD